jgi:starch phosphorylase
MTIQRIDTAVQKPRSGAESELADAIVSHLRYAVGTDPARAQPEEWFLATALTLRSRIVDCWLDSERRSHGQKHVYYLSIEYLVGRMLIDGLCNLDLIQPVRNALASLGVDLAEIRAIEPDAGLGNGGLGRLAACYMESMATRGIPAFGYGIRYAHGLFRQQIRDGWQHELPDEWLTFGNPWEFERRATVFPVGFGGVVEYVGGSERTPRAIWYPEEVVHAVAYDTPTVGWRGRHVTTLRLWSARSTDVHHNFMPRQHDYVGSVMARERAEQISGVLYPSADTPAGQELRLRQEFFFTSASLQDIVRRHTDRHGSLASLPEHAAIQMNDTHPSLAVAELMRILVDEHYIEWPEAWRITTETLNYTNHTLLPEALETWPVGLMNRLLPRHMQIIFLINWLHLKNVAELDASPDNLAANSLIDERGERRVRMGHLAFVGSAKINGVSELHTDLMQKSVFRELDRTFPGRIVNKTNGITFRRWLFQANPRLTELLTDTIGKRFLDDADDLRRIEHHADDAGLLERFAAARKFNKHQLCCAIRDQTGIVADPAALFDVHIKRIHEYKRQLLNILEAIALFHAIRAEPWKTWTPRVKIFAGKAAASYGQAKLIIKLINDVARVINNDPVVGGRLKVVFMPNYNVSLAEIIIPAADLSEQISTAGFEASGTGNMKFALNGALTVGTLDGANIEIRSAVGADNIFIFGMKADEVVARGREGFTGREALEASPRLQQTVGSVAEGVFSPDDRHRFQPLIDRLLGHDEFMVAADFDAYWAVQRDVDARWQEKNDWWRASLLNTARMSWFSADRAINEYAEEIWHVPVGDPPGLR